MELARAFIRADMGETIKFMQDLANYGSHLILRCYSSSQQDIEDVVLVGSLLKHVVAMFDGIIVLLNEGATLPAELAVRSMFEARISAEWILKKDTQQRAKQFVVWHWRRELGWIRAAIKGTDEYLRREKWFTSTLKPRFNAAWNAHEPEAEKEEKKVQVLLNSADFKSINDEFDRLKVPKNGRRRKHDVNWYSLFSGPENFGNLCRQLGLHGHYDVLYNRTSKVAHATTFMQMVTHDKDSLIFESIRNPKDMQGIILYGVSEAIFAYKLFLSKYRFGELPAFQRRYINEWQKPFFSVPKIEIVRGKGTVY